MRALNRVRDRYRAPRTVVHWIGLLAWLLSGGGTRSLARGHSPSRTQGHDSHLQRRYSRLQEARWHYQEGEKLLARGDLRGAEQQWREVLRLKPDSAVTKAGLARIVAQTRVAGEATAPGRSTTSGATSPPQESRPPGIPAGQPERPPDEQPADLRFLLEPVRRKHHLPALAGAVFTGDRVAAAGAVGQRVYGSGVPVTIDDQFHLGSCTKAMTATLVAMLVEQHILSWNTTIAQAFPELDGVMDPVYRAVTLEEVMRHQTGIRESMDGPGPDGKGFLRRLSGSLHEQRMEALAIVLHEPPAAPPGTKFVYSNWNFIIAGAMAESTAKVPWEDLMTAMVFDPLGMATAGFGPMGAPGGADQPEGHLVKEGVPVPVGRGPDADNPEVMGPAGTVHCSLIDWARFLAVHLRGEQGKNDLLSAESIQRLHRPPPGESYAGGWIVVDRDWAGGLALNHAGSNTMNYACAWLAPRKGFGVIVATNEGGEEAARASEEAVTALVSFALHHPLSTMPGIPLPGATPPPAPPPSPSLAL